MQLSLVGERVANGQCEDKFDNFGGKIMRRLMMLLAASLVTSLSWLSTTAMAQRYMAVPSGLYEIEVVTSGKVLDVRREDARTVQQWDRVTARNQQWNVENTGGSFHTIRSAVNGSYLTIGGIGQGASVVTTNRNSRDNLWRFISLGNGEVMIVNSSGLVLDIPGGAVNNGVPMQVWSMVRNNNQRFRLAPVVNTFSGRYPNDRYTGTGRYYYDAGRIAGMNDYQADLTKNYRRHRQDYNRRVERVFSEGYSAGYDDARLAAVGYNRPLNQMNVIERRIYDDGYRLGQQDARNGSIANYRRYRTHYNRQYENIFRVGYEAGYSRFR
jgi:Ricin-type beta-trefoil lectin domain-like